MVFVDGFDGFWYFLKPAQVARGWSPPIALFFGGGAQAAGCVSGEKKSL